MAKRTRPNHRLVKIHYSYSVEDVTTLFGVHKNTVREWLRKGLPTIDRKRPLLILGSALARFLKTRRESAKRPCKAGELYCVKCRQPRAPGGMIEFLPIREPLGNLTASCSVCNSIMHRRANRTKLAAILGSFALRQPLADPHISQRERASPDCDLKGSSVIYANAQPAE